MTKQEFINNIGSVVQEIAPTFGIEVVSPIIAQAIIESAWGNSTLSSKYNNHFGLKCGSYWNGASVNMVTQEEFTKGTLTSIKDNFRVFDDFKAGVIGYFEFISTQRYANLKGITNPRQYLEIIKADGYCTSSTYVNSCMDIINQYNLTQFDNSISPIRFPSENDIINIDQIARDVIAGEYGNGEERKQKLADMFYNLVQTKVNELLRG